ncbi:hypothetical protein VTK73DRAFT_8982 [Phialemonium thermophilum]|uniref:DDHD domain-containing protein n=1 Tax=Phialemonium thermophilum TaxID=223376 RepID=A0ABR3XMC3_9PEZI
MGTERIVMSTDSDHTYGPECRLAPVSNPPVDSWLEGIPPLKAHFFYSSPFPIDDPLSTPPIGGATDPKTAKAPFRPFSRGDSNDLERAWLSLASEECRKDHVRALYDRKNGTSALGPETKQRVHSIVHRLAIKHKEKHDREGEPPSASLTSPTTLPEGAVVVCCPELLIDASAELRNEVCSLWREQQSALDQDHIAGLVMAELQHLRPNAGSRIDGVHSSIGPEAIVERMSSVLHSTPSRTPTPVDTSRTNQFGFEHGQSSLASLAGNAEPPISSTDLHPAIPVRPPVVDDGISGKPFVRVGADDTIRTSPPASLPKWPPSEAHPPSELSTHRDQSKEPVCVHQEPVIPAQMNHVVSAKSSIDVTVGISRLHMVSLPVLQMKPIYWSPLNDIAIVMRATWFYRDDMSPVEPAVANQLEAGYRELRPWTETWGDELRSALDVGAIGEEKISHKLWPDHLPNKSKSRSRLERSSEPSISSDPFCAARCYEGEAALVGTLEAVQQVRKGSKKNDESRSYSNYDVIYKDGCSAFLLKPSLKPSAYYGRKPLAKISKGATVGIPVVRGFDFGTWERLHENKSSSSTRKHRFDLRRFSERPTTSGACPGCREEKDRGQVTDLVLVAHGIGQKIAERVESFHFTHAVNGFRRAVNVELQSDAVLSVLRKGQRGIMVLPVNWRHVLSFEEGGPATEEDREANMPDRFGLKDIEPDTIPAVRSMISDVMFDIPFYMSHYKPKMIAALVGEANRVYRLWCRNNPGFVDNGRVHLIAHSLGSVMAVEILSKQPTRVSPLDLTRPTPATDQFEFDTTNLFFLGSPAGFFLLLERGSLMPRRGRLKPDADPSDVVARDVVGDSGMFGCLAVDNIYNILAREDPIAYLLNGTIDPKYAASLKVAYVPSITTSFLQVIGNAVRGAVGAPVATAPTISSSSAAATAGFTGTTESRARTLPSQLELEVHDFTREEIAERKAYLLNDNGQIDYYLRSGGGPLEIQYLNMLSAHTSYWVNQDLVRMLCMEIGRRPGRTNSLPAMRAVKATKRSIPGVK